MSLQSLLAGMYPTCQADFDALARHHEEGAAATAGTAGDFHRLPIYSLPITSEHLFPNTRPCPLQAHIFR